MNDVYPGRHGRKKAIELRAVEARALLTSTLPYVFSTLTPKQLGQVQRLLDAAVVNPVMRKEYDELMRRSVTARSGQVVLRDHSIVAKADKAFEQQIPDEPWDHRLRLDFSKLLAQDALLPITDNPDEATYLGAIRHTLAEKGVWLRIEPKSMRIPDDPGRWTRDPKHFDVWLSLGPGGDQIPTDTGRLTRDSLLGAVVLGAGYYDRVYRGTVQTTLDKAVRRIRNLIADGESEHDFQEKARREAFPGVTNVSDTLGGASYPSRKIWDTPNDLIVKALQQNVGGNVKDSSQTLIYAAVASQLAAEVLYTYIDKTTRGAARAVKIFTVMTVLGKIAEAVLIVRALVGGMIRLLAADSAAEAGASTATTVAKNRSPAAYYPTNYRGAAAFDKTLNQASITLDTGAGVGMGIDAEAIALQQRVNGWYDVFSAGMKELYAARGRTWATMAELEEVAKKADAIWGNPMAFLP